MGQTVYTQNKSTYVHASPVFLYYYEYWLTMPVLGCLDNELTRNMHKRYWIPSHLPVTLFINENQVINSKL